MSSSDNIPPIRPSPYYNQDDDDASTVQQNTPLPNRDFQKVLNNDEDDDNTSDTTSEGEEEVKETAQDDTKRKKSIFDLNAPRKPVTAAFSEQVATANNPLKKTLMEQSAGAHASVKQMKGDKPDSPSSLFSKMSKAGKKETPSLIAEEGGAGGPAGVGTKGSSDEAEAGGAMSGGGSSSGSNLYHVEQGDLSYVNPLAATSSSAAAFLGSTSDTSNISRVDMQSIINQLVDKVYLIQDQGKTETVVELKYPPMFAGASLVVTSFDSAKGEFNVAFQNLTQQAKNILDMRINQESMKQALEQKGYAVHIVTTTTLVENTVPVEPTQTPQDRQRRQEDQQQRRDRQNRGG